MKKPSKKDSQAPKPKAPSDQLKGWSQIAQFLGQPIAVAQRWAKSGMPVKRQGRFMIGSPEELRQYLGREAGLDVPVHLAANDRDLSLDLKRSLARLRVAQSNKVKTSK